METATVLSIAVTIMMECLCFAEQLRAPIGINRRLASTHRSLRADTPVSNQEVSLTPSNTIDR